MSKMQTRWYSKLPPDGDFASACVLVEHKSMDTALRETSEILADGSEGWPEDVDAIEWGVLVPLQRSQEYDREETPGGECKYRLEASSERLQRVLAALETAGDVDVFELKRIRAIVDEDARKRHGNREGEPSWGVIADCVLAHVSQHRQETEAERQVLRCAEALGYVGEPDRLAIAVGDACLAFAKDLREINARYMVTIKRLEVEADETSQYLRDFEASLVSAGKWDAQPELPLNLLAREIVAQAERWRIDAEHYRSEASNATATMVESLSAKVAQLTGEVAATQAVARRQIETLRKLGEMREHNKARACMELDKARSENAALREEVQMWRDRAESDRKRDVTRGEEFKSALAEALGEQALAYQAAGERKSHSLEVMRGIMRLELAMAEVLRSLARGEQKSNGKVEIIEPIADHDVERSEAPTRVFSADSSVEGLHRRLEEADIRLAGLQDESASLRLSLQKETRKVIEYSDLVDQYKMAMAQVQGASAVQIAAALNPSLGATALRHTLAAQLRAAAKTASAWEEAAIREWAPLAPDYHDGDGTVAAAIEGPYIEHRLVMAWRGQVQRMADNLSADESPPAPTIQRLDYTLLPFGYTMEEDVDADDASVGIWFWNGDADEGGRTRKFGVECTAEADAIADAWIDYKAHNDPPGLEVMDDGLFGWGFQVLRMRTWPTPGTRPVREFHIIDGRQQPARAAAWAWYDRRLALAEPGVRTPFWPRILTWSDDQVAAVERWLVDSTAEMPEVLRG